MLNNGMFSSEDDKYETPRDVFNKLDEEFGFTLDPCALPSTAKCNLCFTPEDNGLSRSWKNQVVFMNLPYGREISKWAKKAYQEWKLGATVVCLVPARTDTRYWHNYFMKASEIRFIKGRLKFGDATNSAPFPSAIVVFREDRDVPVISTWEKP